MIDGIDTVYQQARGANHAKMVVSSNFIVELVERVLELEKQNKALISAVKVCNSITNGAIEKHG